MKFGIRAHRRYIKTKERKEMKYGMNYIYGDEERREK